MLSKRGRKESPKQDLLREKEETFASLDYFFAQLHTWMRALLAFESATVVLCQINVCESMVVPKSQRNLYLLCRRAAERARADGGGIRDAYGDKYWTVEKTIGKVRASHFRS